MAEGAHDRVCHAAAAFFLRHAMDRPRKRGEQGEEVEATKGANGAKQDHDHDHNVEDVEDVESANSTTRQDSWVDAVVTLLATVVFGLGWALVELERADPPSNRYDAIAAEMWVATVVTSVKARAVEARAIEDRAAEFEAVPAGRRGDEDAQWTERALQKSNR